MPNNPIITDTIQCGDHQPFTLIAGPCVIENQLIVDRIAEELKTQCTRLGINLIFKASFDKANRTSVNSFRGPGLEESLRILDNVRKKFGVPVTTDIHESHQAKTVAEVCELLQIPAFLARQTDLLDAAASTGRVVNVKKGQFMAPTDMQFVVDKIEHFGGKNVMVTERGTFFGYGQLVNDMKSLPIMRQIGVPVIFDATHSVQFPSAAGGKTGGNREMVAPLARAAVAVGVDGLFVETHPDPDSSPSDGPNMVPLDDIGELLANLLRIRAAVEFTEG